MLTPRASEPDKEQSTEGSFPRLEVAFADHPALEHAKRELAKHLQGEFEQGGSAEQILDDLLVYLTAGMDPPSASDDSTDALPHGEAHRAGLALERTQGEVQEGRSPAIAVGEAEKPFWRRFAEAGERIPDEEAAAVPEDASERVDALLYG